MSPEGLALIGPFRTSRHLDQSGWNVQSVGGLTLGADPVAYAIAYASALSGRLIRAFTVRKEAKDTRNGQLIEGPFSSGDRVAIVEDVITTGASALKAAATVVDEAGGIVAGVLAVVDRDEGGSEALEAMDSQVIALIHVA